MIYEVTFGDLVGFLIVGVGIGGLIVCAIYWIAAWADRRHDV